MSNDLVGRVGRRMARELRNLRSGGYRRALEKAALEERIGRLEQEIEALKVRQLALENLNHVLRKRLQGGTRDGEGS